MNGKHLRQVVFISLLRDLKDVFSDVENMQTVIKSCHLYNGCANMRTVYIFL